jgi:hypothetical protein
MERACTEDMIKNQKSGGISVPKAGKGLLIIAFRERLLFLRHQLASSKTVSKMVYPNSCHAKTGKVMLLPFPY